MNMKVGQIFRYARPYDSGPKERDGLPNYFHATQSPDCNLPLLESGINPIAKITTTDGKHCPAILISSSPHKIGSSETPWQDYFDPDNGHIHYYGDNKKPGVDPTTSSGNKALIQQFQLHSSTTKEDRTLSSPILVFRRVRVGKRTKGNVQFQGFGIITKCELITQYDRINERPFPNYVFDFTIFDLREENEVFPWEWISLRRNPSIPYKQTLSRAPKSWKKWVKYGPSVVESCRRRIVKLLTISAAEQKPSAKENKLLQAIYGYYGNKKSRFEALAQVVASSVISKNGHNYRRGWITPSTSDGGADFIGRLDIGSGLARAKLIVLGQAKCERVDSPTGGNHIARTVARLRRGWIGVYVTTSYFSEAVQREVLEDNYPILLINGVQIATEVETLMFDAGISSIQDFLDSIDVTYEDQIMNRRPEELLYES